MVISTFDTVTVPETVPKLKQLFIVTLSSDISDSAFLYELDTIAACACAYAARRFDREAESLDFSSCVVKIGIAIATSTALL